MTQSLFLIAHLCDHAVAIDSDKVESVVDLDEITPVPMSGPTLRGLAALRSRVVTVVSVKAALGLDDSSESGRAVIVCVDGHHYALMVDALEDILPLEIRPVSAAMRLEREWQSVAVGVVERGGEPILVIDPVALVPVGNSVAA